MTDQLRDTVDELLDEAEDRLADLPDFEAGDEDEATDALDDADGLDDLAAEAGELIETTDSGELLDAVGLAELSDGSEPESIPEAISEGDPENVVELRSLLKLANLADREGDDRREGIDELRETIGDRSVDEIEETAPSAEDGADTDAVEEESRRDETDESAEAEEDTETEEGTEREEGDFTEQIRSAISGDLEGFRDELEQARDHFEELRDDDGAADGEDGETAEEGDDGEDEEDDDEGDDDDDGLFGKTDESSGGRGTRHSTMAPPPSKRADMGRSTRHSTMPDRN